MSLKVSGTVRLEILSLGLGFEGHFFYKLGLGLGFRLSRPENLKIKFMQMRFQWCQKFLNKKRILKKC